MQWWLKSNWKTWHNIILYDRSNITAVAADKCKRQFSDLCQSEYCWWAAFKVFINLSLLWQTGCFLLWCTRWRYGIWLVIFCCVFASNTVMWQCLCWKWLFGECCHSRGKLSSTRFTYCSVHCVRWHASSDVNKTAVLKTQTKAPGLKTKTSTLKTKTKTSTLKTKTKTPGLKTKTLDLKTKTSTLKTKTSGLKTKTKTSTLKTKTKTPGLKTKTSTLKTKTKTPGLKTKTKTSTLKTKTKTPGLKTKTSTLKTKTPGLKTKTLGLQTKTKTSTLKTKTPHSEHSHYFFTWAMHAKNHFNNLHHSDTIDTISQFR